MQSIIRFSLFGNYEKFNTGNMETYVKLIEFFVPKGYKPTSANELQLLGHTGQVKVIVMPLFINDNGVSIEISSNRINFQKVMDGCTALSEMKETFEAELEETMMTFIREMNVTANRIAVNADIIKNGFEESMATTSNYFETVQRTESNIRNAARKAIAGEETNVILEKFSTNLGQFTKYSYDVNSIPENSQMRFGSENIGLLFEEYMTAALKIEEGAK